MKKLLSIAFLAAALTACKKDKSPDIAPVDLGVNVSYGLSTSTYTLPLNDIKVKLTNINTGNVSEASTDADGKVSFKQISAGTYDIDAVLEIDAATYSQLTGTVTQQNVTFNASIKNTQINAGSNDQLDLKLITGKSGDWVIKQVYYAGSDNANGAIFRDQFVEIYNNTDQVMYADSLYFSQLEGRALPTTSGYYWQANDQYDWSKSVGMPSNIDANNDYVYTSVILMVPGNGKQHPVQPGESIVIAQTALNHKSPFTGNNGSTISVKDPSLTVDLSAADFETYYGNLPGVSPLASDIDNPNVPNMEVIQYTGRDMVLDANGRESYVIFKVDGPDVVKNLPSYYAPLIATPGTSAKKSFQLPISYIIDGVDVQPNLPANRIPKKLNAQIDAGTTFVPKGRYTSQSIIRKTEKTVAGRRILKDTNNSTEDFDYFDVAQPKGFK